MNHVGKGSGQRHWHGRRAEAQEFPSREIFAFAPPLWHYVVVVDLREVLVVGQRQVNALSS